MAWLRVAIIFGTFRCIRVHPFVDDSDDIPILDSLDDKLNINDIVGDDLSVGDILNDGVTNDPPSIEDIIDDEPINVLLDDETNIDDISINDLIDDVTNIDEISIDDLLDDELNVDEISIDDLLDDETNIDEISIDDLLDNEVNFDEISVDDLLDDEVNVDDLVGHVSDKIEDADLGDLLSGGDDGTSDANEDDQHDNQRGTHYPTRQPTHSPSPAPTLAPTLPQIVQSSITIDGMTLTQAMSNKFIFAEAIASMAGVESSVITLFFSETEQTRRRRLLEATKLVVTYLIPTSVGSAQNVASAMQNATTTTVTEAIQETAETHNRAELFVEIETTSVSAVAVFSATAPPTTIPTSLPTLERDGSSSSEGKSDKKNILLVSLLPGIIGVAAVSLCKLSKKYLRASHVAPLN